MKVLYLYSGTRKDKGLPGINFPDTQLYGLNHLGAFGIHAEHKELGDALPTWVAKHIPFRLRHLLLYFFTRKYDIVFGSSLLYLLSLQKVFRFKTKFVLLDISLSRTISANKRKKVRYTIIQFLLKELTAVVSLADTQKRHIESEMPFLRGKVFTVRLGVDTQYHRPQFTGRKEYILSVGRDNGRDYDTVIKAARSLPEKDFHIVCSERNISEKSPLSHTFPVKKLI